MLHEDLILRGQPGNYSVSSNVPIGQHYIDCIKKRRPDDVFCIDGVTGKHLTCGQLLDQTFKTVIILRDLGVESGDVVSIISQNSMQYCFILYACHYIGAPTNLINPIYTTGELKRLLNVSKPKIIACSGSVLKKLSELKREGVLINQILLLDEVSQTESFISLEAVVLQELLETTIIKNEKLTPPTIDVNKDTLLLLLSSGTTGLPKCVMLTYRNALYSVGLFGDPNFIGMNSSDVTIAVLPFFHIFGYSTLTVAALYSIKLVILDSFQPEVYLRCIEQYRVTLLYTIPPMVSFLANHPLVKKHELTSIKKILCGGSQLPLETRNEFSKVNPNANIIETYGATELCGVTLLPPINVPVKSESIGKVVPFTEAMVWSAELAENVGAFEKGELCFRSGSIMKGYMGNEYADIDEYGFYHTGDVGFFDDDAYFYIVGRSKELIKYKGFQVAPAEVENILRKHEAVLECAVFGVPDKKVGELPTAFIVRQPQSNVTEKEIVDFVAERISLHKQLHGGVKFIPSIPKNVLGKILRKDLLEMYKAM